MTRKGAGRKGGHWLKNWEILRRYKTKVPFYFLASKAPQRLSSLSFSISRSFLRRFLEPSEKEIRSRRLAHLTDCIVKVIKWSRANQIPTGILPQNLRGDLPVIFFFVKIYLWFCFSILLCKFSSSKFSMENNYRCFFEYFHWVLRAWPDSFLKIQISQERKFYSQPLKTDFLGACIRSLDCIIT